MSFWEEDVTVTVPSYSLPASFREPMGALDLPKSFVGAEPGWASGPASLATLPGTIGASPNRGRVMDGQYSLI